jgi:putative transposase
MELIPYIAHAPIPKHVIIVDEPTCHRILEGVVKDLVDRDIRSLSERKGCEVEELNVQKDHVHIIVSILPKVSVSEYIGIIKGKNAIKLFKTYPQLEGEAVLG